MTAGIPDSAGVPAGATQDTLTAVYNNLESVKMLFEENEGQIAAVIVEPVAANMGVVLPKEGFLKGLRELCTNHGAVLIFDEVITGFRLAFGGVQERFGIEADLVTYGKIIGAGMPVGAFGGKREIMEVIAPVGHVYQAGTLSGNPVAMAAGLTQLKILKNHPEIYTHMSQMGEKLYEGMKELVKKYGLESKVKFIGQSFDIPALLMVSDIVLSTAVEPEAFGRAAIEGQAMGKIVIASNLGGSLENTIDGVTGKLYESSDPQALADAIRWALDLPLEEKKKISAAAIKNVKENFTKQIMCDKTIAVYNELINMD